MKLKVWLSSLVFSFLALPSLGAESLGEFIMHHMANSDQWRPIPGGPIIPLPAHIQIGGVEMGISLHVLMMLLAMVLLLVVFGLAGKRQALLPTSKFGYAMEALVLFVRNDIIVPNLGEKEAPKWMPFFLTLFTFILGLNVIGLIPGFPSAASNVNITAALSIMIFIVFNIAGMMHNGVGHYLSNLIPKGVPVFVLPIIAPIEILGLFTKAFALAIRLFANMAAGHILILSLLGLIAVFKSWLFVGPFLGFTLFIYMIEVLVAFLQAFVFTLLASLFIGMALHQEH